MAVLRSRVAMYLCTVVAGLLFFAGSGAAFAQQATQTATFSMYCYWTGEATVGRVVGVVASRIGHWGGNEIVQVEYDPDLTSTAELAQVLKGQRSFYAVVVGSDAERGHLARHLGPGEITVRSGKPHFIEPKHSLRTRHPEIARLDLTERQAIALNSWSYFGGPMPDVLTPGQKRSLEDAAGRTAPRDKASPPQRP